MRKKYYLCRRFWRLSHMKVKWTLLLDDACGLVDNKHYARHIPGNGKWAAVCNKPELSEKTKKKKAAHPTCKSFSELIAICRGILHNPVARGMWQERYDEAKRKARRHGKEVPGRLCDYVRHEVSEALKRGELKPTPGPSL